MNRCVIDALNMYFGGPLYDTWEKFLEYYRYTKKMKKEFAPEDVKLRGISLSNFHNPVFLRNYFINFKKLNL